NCLTTSSPAPISILNAVGALYQTVIPKSSIVLYQLSGLKRPPTITFVAPFNHGPKIPYEVPVTQPGSAVHQYISSSFKSNIHFAVWYCCIIALCTWRTPLGLPVEPDV